MNLLHYRIHLILNSKYKIFINLFIIFVIYFFIYGDKIVFCMMDDANNNTEVPIIEGTTDTKKLSPEDELHKRVQETRKRWKPIYIGECKGVSLRPYTTNENIPSLETPTIGEAKDISDDR